MHGNKLLSNLWYDGVASGTIGDSHAYRNIRIPDIIHVVYGSRDTLAEVVRNWLKGEGFETSTDSTNRTVYVQGQRNRPVWDLLRSGVPPRLRIAVESTNASLSRVSVWFDATRQFHAQLFSTLAAGFSLSLALFALVAILARPTPLGIALALSLFFAGALGLALACAFSFWLISHATNYARMGKRLFDEIETQIGGHAEVIRILPMSREFFGVSVIVLLSLGAFIAPWWKFPEAQFGLALMLTALGWLWWIFQKARQSGAGIRWTPFHLPLICSGLLALYSTAPFWFMWEPIHFVMTSRIWVLMMVVIVIILGPFLCSYRGFIGRLINEIDFMRAHPDLLSDNRTRSRSMDIPMFLSWLLFSVSHWFVMFEMIRVFLNFSFSPYTHRHSVWLLLYWFPVACVLSAVISRNLGRRCESTISTSEVPQMASDVVTAVCRFANLPRPGLALNGSAVIKASVSLSLRPILTISQGALDRLTIEEMGALLAHEIGHLKRRHVFALGMLTFLSRWTILGEGFLTALTPGSVVMEYQADAFAISWLKYRGQSRRVLIDLLRKIERESILQSFSTEAGARIHEPSDDWIPADIRRSVNESSTASPIDRLKTIGRFLHFMIFENWAAFYVYPPLHSRIKAIEEL